jgi:hypothetical protein
MIADAGGAEGAEAKYGLESSGRASRWEAFRVAAKVTPRASRVAAFISLWGLALDELDRDQLTVDEYAEWANEARATAFRRAADYRELWPDVDVNNLGRSVRDHVRAHRQFRRNANALVSIPLTA